MAIYTVHVPDDDGDAYRRADRTVFVRDGFSLAAFLFGPLYLLRCRAWIAAVLWIIFVGLGLWLWRLLHLPLLGAVGMGVLVALLTGLEANSLWRLALHRRGLDVVDVVEGRTRQDGERAFFRKAALDGLPARRTAAGAAAGPDEAVIGFFETGRSP